MKDEGGRLSSQAGGPAPIHPSSFRLHPSARTVTAYVALGANLGDRAANIRAAVRKLDETPGVTVARVSANYENPAVGGPPGSPPFYNAVAKVDTTLPPPALLARLLEIERELGRVRRDKWEPRPIDLDLILYDYAVIESDDLTIPHPRMHERGFVLMPLAEIAPDALHVGLGATALELLHRLPAAERAMARAPVPVLPAAGPVGYFDRLNGFDKVCAALALLLGVALLLLGPIGLFAGSSANFSLPPVLGFLPAVFGWGIVKAVIVAFRATARARRSPPAAPRGFPLD